jgi:hypothetical protein
MSLKISCEIELRCSFEMTLVLIAFNGFAL